MSEDLPPVIEKVSDRVAMRNPGVAPDSPEFRKMLGAALVFYLGTLYGAKLTHVEMQEYANKIVDGDIVDAEIDIANGKIKLITKETEI